MKHNFLTVVVVVQSLSCPTLCDPMNCCMPDLPLLHYLPEFAQIHVYWVCDTIQPSHPLSPLLLLLSIFSSIMVFSNKSALCIRWSKYWSFSFSISPSNEYSGLISLRIDWLDHLAVQGTLKSLLQYHNLASVLHLSPFFMAPQIKPMFPASPALAGRFFTTGSIPGLGISPGGRHGNPLQYSCLENLMDRGAWRAIVHRVAKESDMT